MKKWILCAAIIASMAACADTRNHVSNDATSWEKVRYHNPAN